MSERLLGAEQLALEQNGCWRVGVQLANQLGFLGHAELELPPMQTVRVRVAPEPCVAVPPIALSPQAAQPCG